MRRNLKRFFSFFAVRLNSSIAEGYRTMIHRRLLCVDDDSGYRQFYKNLLGSYGYEVTVAASGRQALRLFLSRKVDAVLTDFEMPEMSGGELAARLKRMRPELPVLLVSGSKAAQETPPPAVDATLAKGAPPSKLVDQIETLLEKCHSRPVGLNPRRFAPLGSVLASIALAAYALPRILK
jgi:CheY-like chemotaxis protein